MTENSADRPRYSNPLISRDVPDPDAIALSTGGYALVASSFGRRPGLPLWHSDDLVDWTPVGFAGGYAPLLQESGGVWAPAIREHDGRLWITWADPDRGVFVTDASSLAGPWSAPRLIIAGPGPIDPCPFWDDAGRTWMVHAWARSRAGFANRLDIVEVDAGLTRTLDAGRVLIDGDAIEGCTVLEGPKVYARNGEVWVFAPAGGVETGWQYAFRASSLVGPWEERVVLAQGAADVNGPHQGAWVVGEGGEEWFLHFQHTPRHGRILHLQPLAWGDDGWPLVGAAVAGGPPEPVREWLRPTSRPGVAPAADPIGDWHGRGGDPAHIVARRSGRRLELAPLGRLARPLDVSTMRIEATLLSGSGEIAVLGAEEHALRVEGGVVSLGEVRLAEATLPVRLGVEFVDDRMRFTVDGAPVSDEVVLRPSQWTGIEFALAAVGEGPATFADIAAAG